MSTDTTQLYRCYECDEPTGRCEEDKMCGPADDDQEPLCDQCYEAAWEVTR